jgi:ketosteroid isomerase-like protein
MRGMTIQAATNDERELTRLEHEAHEAFLRNDSGTVSRILADDFIFTDPEGKFVTKAEWIADMESGELTFESIHMDDLRVRVYGDAAVTNGRVTMKMRAKEGSVTSHYCYIAMYVRRDGRWQAVAEQATLLARP